MGSVSSWEWWLRAILGYCAAVATVLAFPLIYLLASLNWRTDDLGGALSFFLILMLGCAVFTLLFSLPVALAGIILGRLLHISSPFYFISVGLAAAGLFITVEAAGVLRSPETGLLVIAAMLLGGLGGCVFWFIAVRQRTAQRTA